MQQQEYTEATRFLISVLHRFWPQNSHCRGRVEITSDARPFLYLMQYSNSRTVTSWVELLKHHVAIWATSLHKDLCLLCQG